MKIDLEKMIFMFIFKLKKVKNKDLINKDCDVHLAYVFNSHEECKNYFIQHGYTDIDDQMVDEYVMRTTDKGSLICLKKLCDNAIVRHINNNVLYPKILKHKK